MTLFPEVLNKAARPYALRGQAACWRNDGEAALDSFQMAYAWSGSALTREPQSFIHRRDCAIGWDQLGYARQLCGDIQLAYIAYGEADRHYKALVAIEGAYGLLDRERAKFLERLWALRRLDGDEAGAAGARNEAVQIMTARYAAKPGIERLIDLTIMIAKLSV